MIKTLSAASLTLLMAAAAAPAFAQSAPDWSGPYVGVYGAVQDNKDDSDERLVFDRDFDGDFDDTVILSGTTNSAFSPGSCAGNARAQAAGDGCNSDQSGAEVSVRAGYDMQFGSFVVGAVAEYGISDLQDTVTSFSTTPAAYVFERELEQMAALRLRAGYAAGPALIYVTGGGAYAKVDQNFRTTNGLNSFTEQSNDDKADGYQVGGGLEWRLAPSLSVTAEYLYTDLDIGEYVVRAGPGTAGPTNPFILPPNTAGTDLARSSDTMQFHAVKLGMNVRF
ncbi:MAG: outer membrane protein [Brevundimonas sp.]